MGEGVLHRRGGEALARPGAESAARGGQVEIPDFPVLPPGEALEDRRVLAVHRDQFGRGIGRELTLDDLSREHEHLLAGERDPLPGPKRGDDRLEPGGSDDGAEHDVGLRGCDEFVDLFHPPRRLQVRRKEFRELSGPGRIGGDRPLRTEFRRLRGELRKIVPGHEPDYMETFRQRGQRGARASADRAGCSEYDYAFPHYRDSARMVTGPSFRIETSISAPNLPVATRTPYPRQSSTNFS